MSIVFLCVAVYRLILPPAILHSLRQGNPFGTEVPTEGYAQDDADADHCGEYNEPVVIEDRSIISPPGTVAGKVSMCDRFVITVNLQIAETKY